MNGVIVVEFKAEPSAYPLFDRDAVTVTVVVAVHHLVVQVIFGYPAAVPGGDFLAAAGNGSPQRHIVFLLDP